MWFVAMCVPHVKIGGSPLKLVSKYNPYENFVSIPKSHVKVLDSLQNPIIYLGPPSLGKDIESTTVY